MKKLVSIAVALAFCASANAAIHDGVYETKVTGHNAPITLTVTIQKGKITGVTTKDLESRGVGKVALSKKSQEVIEHQSLGIDTMSGATITSMALLSGIEECLEKAGATEKELEGWNKNVIKHPTTPLTVQTDVVIVGGGGTGLAAAISALENGASKVVIVEKLGFLGGSTQVSGGALNAVDDKRQKAQGIVDSKAEFFEATMRGGHYVGNPELVHYLTYNSMSAVEWMESLGVEFRDKIGAATGSLGQRSHYGKKPAGWAYTSVFEEVLKTKYKDRVEIFLESPAQEILTDKKGNVVGVKASRHGQPITIKASSTILATGGFGANVKFRQEVNNGVWKEVKLDKRIGTSNINKAAQGDGLVMAKKIGADVIGLSDIQLHPNGTPGTGLMQDIATSGRNRLFINDNGERFVNEGAARDTLCKAIFKQPGGGYWLVMNKLRYPDMNKPDRMGVTMHDMLSLGRVKTANTLDELAKIINVPADKLKASVEEYNKVASHQVESDRFGFKATNTDDAPMTEGPWYACRKVPTVHHTMGGVRINVNAQVLKADGTPIKGLYAAGEVTGGIHGANRLGGNAIADVYTFGRVAGESAAKKL